MSRIGVAISARAAAVAAMATPATTMTSAQVLPPTARSRSSPFSNAPMMPRRWDAMALGLLPEGEVVGDRGLVGAGQADVAGQVPAAGHQQREPRRLLHQDLAAVGRVHV